MKEYELIGYKGKQVRDNIHSNDLINAFWSYYLKPSKESIYNKVVDVFLIAQFLKL